MVHRYRTLTLLALTTTLMCLSGPASSAKEFYKWQDEKGVTHYSSAPPKDVKAVKVRATNLHGEGAASDSEEEASSDNSAANDSQSAAAEPARDPERCAQAQKNLKTMEENARIRIKEGDEYRYLSVEEIEQQKSTMREIIDTEC